MASRATRPCSAFTPAGPCPELATSGGRCDEHQRKPWEGRGSRQERGYTARWRRARDAYRATHPTCEHPGCDRDTAEIDHVIPLSQGGAVADRRNFQALCKEHHDIKTRAESLAGRSRKTPDHKG